MKEQEFKILQVISRLDPGGAERVFVDICNMLTKKNHKIVAMFTRDIGTLADQLDSNIKIISLKRKWKFSLFSVIKVLVIINKFDIIHIHSRHAFMFIKIISLLFPFKKYNLILHDHYGKIEINKSVPFFLKVFSKNFTYLGVSSDLTTWAKDVVKIKNKNIFNLYNIRFIDQKKIQKNFNEKFENKDIIKYVLVSNIHPVKNIEFSIELFYHLKKQRKSSLTIYGNKSDIKYFLFLKKIINNLKLNDSVKFIFNEKNIPSILNQFDFGLYSSKSESGPLVLIEYLSQGLPFLSFKTGQVASQISNIYPELFIENFNLSEWTHKINNLHSLSQNEKKDFIKTYNELYSPDNYYEKLVNIYNSLLGL